MGGGGGDLCVVELSVVKVIIDSRSEFIEPFDGFVFCINFALIKFSESTIVSSFFVVRYIKSRNPKKRFH